MWHKLTHINVELSLQNNDETMMTYAHFYGGH